MFNLFGNNKKEKNDSTLQAARQELGALEARWKTFLDKLEEKYNELLEAVEQEGPATYAADTDPYKRAFIHFKNGINGQLDGIRKKATETCDLQIRDYYRLHDHGIMHPAHDLLYSWRERCLNLHNEWEDRTASKRDEVWEKVAIADDPEIKYQAILTEYEKIRDKFSCKQCGNPILIDKIYFIDTYLACPACQTQNTFIPGAEARGLEHVARELAEQRTAHLLKAYKSEQQREQDLYEECHRLKLTTIHEQDRKVLAAKQARMKELEEQRQAAICNAPGLYRNYLRAMFDEWNLLVPDLSEQNERFYQRQLAEFNRMND